MEKKVIVEGQINTIINFAMQQNYVPVIRKIVVRNMSNEVKSGLWLKVIFEPEFARTFTYQIGEIPSGGSIEINPVKIQLCTAFLFSLTEKIVGSVVIELFEGDNRIDSFDSQIEVLAYDEWSGLNVMPEIITAFVTPNNPKVSEIIKKAGIFLNMWMSKPEFTAYQTKNPSVVKLQMAAIYKALQEELITYTNPPASYEAVGQRVRLPHAVLEQKQGTCLDLSVLYAACLEAVGLFPLIIFMQGHSFVGCWLEEQTFADCMIDEVSAFIKRTTNQVEELLFVECTDFVAGKQIEFVQAAVHGKTHLFEESFVCGIDVRRSRGNGIRPIPERLDEKIVSNENRKEEPQVTKQKMWERKLLDFSLRNTLLNFRVTKTAIQLMSGTLSELEDKLSEGKEFKLLELPKEVKVQATESKIFTAESDTSRMVEKAFQQERILTYLQEEELEKNLKNLRRAAKVSLEENGSNTLYLALGFLKWYETDTSEKERYAPIVLIPIELVRNNRGKGYIIRSRQEEAQVNITLLEYLKQDYQIAITGLDPIPMDEHGIDLDLIFQTIRQAISSKKRWETINLTFMGLFSFGQFVMWNDLRNRSEKLKENKVVASLLEGKMMWKPEGVILKAEELDSNTRPEDMAVPLRADSSQMVAIAAAAGGQSFVLHGPPGTGKSQTITNMIANSLYQGKSVLFVAEKMAALNVVEKRLASIGLAPFCLELHSNKANKSSVLSQLNEVLEVGHGMSPASYIRTADKLYELRKELNHVVEAIHQKREYGCSLYEAIEQYERTKQFKGKINLNINQEVTGKQIEVWKDNIRQFAISSEQIGTFAKNPLAGYESQEYSMELKRQFERDLDEIIRQARAAKISHEWLQDWTGIRGKKDWQSIQLLLQVGEVAMNPSVTLVNLLRSKEYESIKSALMNLMQTGREQNVLFLEIMDIFEPQVAEYNASDALKRWTKAENAWMLSKTLQQNKLIKELNEYAKQESAVDKENIVTYYRKLDLLIKRTEKLDRMSIELRQYMGGIFLGEQTDWNCFEDAVEKADQIYKTINTLSAEEQESVIKACLHSEQFVEVSNHMEQVQAFIKLVERLKANYKVTSLEKGKQGDWIEYCETITHRYKEHSSELKSMVLFNQQAKEMENCGLNSIVKAYKRGALVPNEFLGAFLYSLYYELILKTIASDDKLLGFQGKQFEDGICQFKEIIEKFRELSIQELIARLSTKVPIAGMESVSSSELGILKRAIKSNGRMMSIRRLFEQIPTLLRKICPCMLMSPISVAQYIDPSFPKFDLVIFDEASQLPTSEAVGTIARGKDVIVVGDPKQLPPTSFFQSNQMDEENYEIEDLESLLDDCLALSMPQEHLKWHYRSRHESLIAFSNMQYYDNKLYTFPSPNDLMSEVSLVHVDGFYDKGKTKQNRAEAEAVVVEIVRRLNDEVLRKESIGVVTFSSVQQNLIDDLLSEEFAKHPELEEIDAEASEPIFIKNLENVQGDERDVILFSIGYGPDQEGKVSMNFGPLNREGGWRRLNVAISRARKKMIVYAVIRPDQIALSKTRSEGLSGLKGFLEFAERGKNSLTAPIGTSPSDRDVIQKEVKTALQELGYEVGCNIGCSSYKLDLGVVNPKDENSYLLGILLDGSHCKETATAEDRFLLQPDILRGLGWNIMRVWVMEWLENPDAVMKQIKRKIDEAIANNKHKQEKEEVKTIPVKQLKFAKIEEPLKAQSISHSYETVEVHTLGTSKEFYEDVSKNKNKKLIEEILKVEAPISKKMLVKKVLGYWGITRSGAKQDAAVLNILQQMNTLVTTDNENLFYWRKDQVPEMYTGYRVEDQFGNRRSMDDICSYEILNAIEEVLKEQVGIQRKDLVRLTAKKFGFSRLGNVIEVAVENAVEKGVELDRITVFEDEKVILKEG